MKFFIQYFRLGLKLFFGIYALLFFLLTLIFVIPFYYVIFKTCSKKKSPHYAHRISQLWSKLLFIFFLIRVKVKGKELIDETKTYIFVSNHCSQLDIPVFAVACNNTFRFLSKAELTKVPIMGYIIRKLYITVNRSDKADRSKSLEAMKNSVMEGISVFLCPEGTRNKTCKPLLDFKDGAFLLAIETQTPLAVLTVINTGKLLSPLHTIALSPGTIYAVWEKPVETKGMTQADIPQLKEAAKRIMLKNLESPVVFSLKNKP